MAVRLDPARNDPLAQHKLRSGEGEKFGGKGGRVARGEAHWGVGRGGAVISRELGGGGWRVEVRGRPSVTHRPTAACTAFEIFSFRSVRPTLNPKPCLPTTPLRPRLPRRPSHAAPPTPPLPRRPSHAAPPSPPLPRRPSLAAPPTPPLPRRPSHAAPPTPPLPRRPSHAAPPLPSALLRALHLPLEVALGGEAGGGQAEGGTGRGGEGVAGQEAEKGGARRGEERGTGQAELDSLLMAARVLELNHDEFYFLASPPRAPVSPRNELQSLRRIRLALLPLLHPPPFSAASPAPAPLPCAPEMEEKGWAVVEAMMGEVLRRLRGLGEEAGGEAAGQTGGETAGERGKGERCGAGDGRGAEREEGEKGEKGEEGGEGQREAERRLMEWAVTHGATCELDVRGARGQEGARGRGGGGSGRGGKGERGRGERKGGREAGRGEKREGERLKFPGTGRGMGARGAMEAGETVLSIPLPLIISPLTALASPLGQAVRRGAGEKAIGRSSRVATEQREEAEGRVQSGNVEEAVQGREAGGAQCGAERGVQSGKAEGGAEADQLRGKEEDTDMGDIEDGRTVVEEDGVDVCSISDESIALLWTIQQRHDPSSFYAPFFNTLPAVINTGGAPSSSPLLSSHISLDDTFHIHAEYHSLFPALSQRYPSLFPPALFSLSAFTAAAEL
ncbi:unnamed protein product, partial [Closterium sp. NIES-64]